MDNKRYFKITNEKENHNGFQYVDGLNILDKPFEEEGSCVKGGLYFSDAINILDFLSYGIYLREITLPFSDPDFKMTIDPAGKKWRANKLILGKKYSLFDISTFEFLIECGAIFSTIDNDFVIKALENGCVDVVKFYIEKCTYVNDELIEYMCKTGNLEIIKILCPSSDTVIRTNSYIQLASHHGHLDVVKFLFSKNNKVNIDYALGSASMSGHIEIVKFFIERGADPRYNNNQALRWAQLRGHSKIIDFLKKIE